MNQPRVAAIVTEYRPNSHADVIVTKLLEGYEFDGVHTPSRLQVASLYLDQVPPNDMGRQMAAKHGVPIFGSIGEALTLGGSGINVDGVVLIGEHGEYPLNPQGQNMYPRRRFFEAAVAAMTAAGRVVPVFTDKHLSWSFSNARWMVDTAERLGVPLLAGSSVPLWWRLPQLTWQPGAEVNEALALGYGDKEAYGFHALEMLECMIEQRSGGETGVRSVLCVEGDEVWRAGSDGRWDPALLETALATVHGPSIEEARRLAKNPSAFLIEFNDGLRTSVLMLGGAVSEFAFVGERSGGIESCWFYGQNEQPFGHFTFLVRQIESLILSGRPPYPVDRTLLTTGILDAAMRSRFEGHVTIETPELDISYDAPPEVPDTGVGRQPPPQTVPENDG